MSGVNVSVEVPLENQVFEINYDGQEIQHPPLSMSENLSRLAQRIDFLGKDEESGRGAAASAAGEPSTENGGGSDSQTFKTTPAWPWETCRSKLHTALTELSVLGDIISISQQKKYLVLDPVSAEPSDSKAGAVLFYKKKGLGAAAHVLLNGAERLKIAMNEAKTKTSQSISYLPDFHFQLLKLRQNWRLRKVGNSILGDLSYRTAGSRFPQTGIFEVKKAEDTDDQESTEDSSSATAAGTGGGQSSSKPSSALKVIVPNELQGIAYIEVVIQKDQETLSFANIGLPSPTPAPLDATWQQRLEAAQNVLFCKELFSVLAREAVALHSLPIPPLIVGSQITATLFPGILLIISLCHSINGKTSATPVTPKLDHNQVLEHSLHQLLREVHRSNACIPLPHPASAPIGISRKRRLAGPFAYDKQILLAMTKKEGILEEIIKQSQHVVLRMRTMAVLDALSREIKDPLITSHWTSLNAVTHTCVRITLVSSGYDMCGRTPLILHVKEKSLKAILKDGKAINLSYEPQELRDLIFAQIAIHQVMALQSLSKCMGWTVLASNTHLGVGPCETIGNAAGCVLSSPNGKRQLAVRSSPAIYHSSFSTIQVFIGYPPNSRIEGLGDVVEDVHHTSSIVPGSESFPFEGLDLNSEGGLIYKPIKLDRLDGKNFVNKIEMLMAVLGDVNE